MNWARRNHQSTLRTELWTSKICGLEFFGPLAGRSRVIAKPTNGSNFAIYSGTLAQMENKCTQDKMMILGLASC
jgi:hypothetical protein